MLIFDMLETHSSVTAALEAVEAGWCSDSYVAVSIKAR